MTKGFAAHNNAFAEYIAKKDSCICIKEAVNGTTLIDNCEDSYIERMRDNLDPERQVDLFICQLSTNDATRNSPLGEISESRDLDSSMSNRLRCDRVHHCVCKRNVALPGHVLH